MNTNLNRNLLTENFPLLANDPFKRFFEYRINVNKTITDKDRSKLALEIYEKLNWYKKSNMLLEPDTFFASSYNALRLLFLKYDSDFFRNDFKIFVKNQNYNYNKLCSDDYYTLKNLRYKWFLEDYVREHYNFICNNSFVINYIEATHKIGNFLIIPKSFGSTKAKTFSENPFKSLLELETNFLTKYKNNYKLESFENLISVYLLENCYGKNNNIIDKLGIDFKNDSFKKIFEKMEFISYVINKRTLKIINKIENKI